MAMHVFSLTSTQKATGQEIYGGFYNYAIGQGADSATATQFANIGLGVSSGEGLGKGGSGWTPNPDGGVTSVGPFQLNINTGIGADLHGDYSHANQIQVAASNMWGETGTGGTFDTQPWNAVGDTTGPGHGVGNDTFAGQTAAENIGAQIAARNGFTAGGAPAPAPAPQLAPDGSPLAGGVGPVVGEPDGNSLTVATPEQAAQLGQQAAPQPAAQLGQQAAPQPAAQLGQQAAPQQAAPVGSTTIPQAIDNQSKTMKADTDAATKAASGISDAVIKATDAIAATASATEKNIFSRGVMILVGVVFVVGGLYMFGRATVANGFKGVTA